MPNAKDALCRCTCAYLGAQAAGTPIRCERCRGLVDGVAAQRMEAVCAESRRRLMRSRIRGPRLADSRPVTPPEVADA